MKLLYFTLLLNFLIFPTYIESFRSICGIRSNSCISSSGIRRSYYSHQALNDIYLNFDVGSMILAIEEKAMVVPYEKEPIPLWVSAVAASLIIGTILVPQIARKKQLQKNQRDLPPDL